MDYQNISLEEISVILQNARQETTTRNKFPKQLWDSIILLTDIHPISEICNHLQIRPSYLRYKMQVHKADPVEFHEVALQDIHSNTIVIEINSNSGLRAKIQGPISCLNCLNQLFKE
jgi:hypothetical protein